jgi:flagellar basal body rod protein FlgF
MRDWLEADLSGVSVSPRILRRTLAEMRVIGHAARVKVPSAAENAEAYDGTIVAGDLGPSPDTDIWPGSLRDPLVVYYNGQVGNFVRTR